MKYKNMLTSTVNNPEILSLYTHKSNESKIKNCSFKSFITEVFFTKLFIEIKIENNITQWK